MMYLTFKSAEVRLAVPIDAVREVLPAMALSSIPSPIPQVAGILELRGDALTVVDLAWLIHGRSRELDTHQRLLILESGTSSIAVLIDEIEELLEADPSSFQELSGESPTWVHEVHTDGERITLLLDIGGLLVKAPSPELDDILV